MSNKLSHSAIQRFKMCGQSYRLHYIEKIRPIGTTGPLIFGAAFDAAINSLLENKEETAENIFERQFRYQKINGEEIYLPTSPDISYSKADFDSDLLTEADVATLTRQLEESRLQGYSDHISAYKAIKALDEPSREEKVYRNLASWLTLYRKGLLMINAYRVKVLPLLTEVKAVQKEFSLDNGVGDKLVGVIDLVADVKGFGTVILDNKTAGRPYEKDAVLKSEQLSLYVHTLEEEYNTRKAGYIVLNKNVVKNKVKVCQKCGFTQYGGSHKTCPEVVEGVRCNGDWDITMTPDISVQFLVDEIPETFEATVINDADEVNTKVSCGEFGKCNIEQCRNWYGQPCCYYNYCHGDGSMEGLVQMGKKDAK